MPKYHFTLIQNAYLNLVSYTSYLGYQIVNPNKSKPRTAGSTQNDRINYHATLHTRIWLYTEITVSMACNPHPSLIVTASTEIQTIR